MLSAMLVAIVVSAAPTTEQIEMLTTFHKEFIAITPGKGKFPKTFLMGDETTSADQKPARQVMLRESFSVAKYEVPQNLWQAVMGNNPSRWKGDRNSVEMLSFSEAEQFCSQATRLMRAAKLIAKDEEIRLPSEAEWEYVARAGSTSRYSFGDKIADLDAYAWHTGNASGNDPPVGAKKPNPWGLYDMHGYLWEWCADPWHDNYQDAPKDSSVWSKGGDANKRVLRSGSWKDKPEKLTSAYRFGVSKDSRDSAVGLRCVLAKVKK